MPVPTVGAGTATIAFQAVVSEAVSGTPDGTLGPFTVASAAGQERLLCLCSILVDENNDSFSNVSIGGQAAVQVGLYARRSDINSNGFIMSWWRAPGTASTSISVTYSNTNSSSIFDVRGIIWSLNNARQVIGATYAGWPTVPPAVMRLKTAPGGVVAAALLATSSTTKATTWAGVTERFEGSSLYGNDWVGAADLNVVSGSVRLPITITFPGDFVNDGWVAMAVSFD
jgi:hypothetical protein